MITKYKNRYILTESSEPVDVNDRGTALDIASSIDRQLGEIGRVELNPKPVYQYNPNVFILRVKRGYERKVILALSFIKDINGKRLGLYTIRTSGTIRSLIKYCKNTYH